MQRDIDNGDGTGEIANAKERESPTKRGGRGARASVDSRNGDLNVEAAAHRASGDSRDGRAGTRGGRASTGGPEHVQG